MARSVRSTLMWAASVLSAFALSAHQAVQASESIYSSRPLKLPQIAPGAQCPVSIGSDDVVSSAHEYIFGAGGYFFGSGPVYVGLAWKPRNRAEARFELIEDMPRVSQGYRLKTPWVMEPEYEGELLVRGARIGPAGTRPILFRVPQQPVGPAMVLRSKVPGTYVPPAQARQVDAVWGFWPTSMFIPEPGCYALQMDTKSKSDIVVFEVTQEK